MFAIRAILEESLTLTYLYIYMSQFAILSEYLRLKNIYSFLWCTYTLDVSHLDNI